MKCPKCQSELEGDGPCRTCSEAARPGEDRFNISFKKFGTSELLEISPKKKDARAASPSPAQKPQKLRAGRHLKTKPVDNGNRSFLLAAGAVLLVVLITAVFFWFFYGRR